MSWQPIAHGAHVNWAQPDPLKGLDPYLVWADGTGFAPYGGLKPPGKIATLIELKAGKTVADLVAQSGGGVQLADIPGVYRAPGAQPRFLTAWPTAAWPRSRGPRSSAICPRPGTPGPSSTGRP